MRVQNVSVGNNYKNQQGPNFKMVFKFPDKKITQKVFDISKNYFLHPEVIGCKNKSGSDRFIKQVDKLLFSLKNILITPTFMKIYEELPSKEAKVKFVSNLKKPIKVPKGLIKKCSLAKEIIWSQLLQALNNLEQKKASKWQIPTN